MTGGWWGHAACATHPDAPGLFYDPARVAEAKAVCRRCPVRGSCLVEALERREEQGVWGGLTPAERVRHRCRVEESERAVVHDQVCRGAGSTRELSVRLGVDQATLRRHLARLERDGLVRIRRGGTGSSWRLEPAQRVAP